MERFAPFWSSLKTDRWDLEAVSSGARIPFVKTPFQRHPGVNMPFSPKMAATCSEKVFSFLAKGAVEKIEMEDRCFVSGIFVILMSSGGFRSLINFKGLNKFVDHFHFKMEDVSVVLKEMARKREFVTKIDLQTRFCERIDLHKIKFASKLKTWSPHRLVDFEWIDPHIYEICRQNS